MLSFSKNGLKWLEFDILSNLAHASFSRRGGKSTGFFDSLNLSYGVGDDSESVKANRQLIVDHFNSAKLVSSLQCHSKKIARVFKHSPEVLENFDALVTNEPGLALLINHADCQAGIFFDPIQKALGVVHAGWRGSVLNIYGDTIGYMQKAFGTNPADLLVGISPSLGPLDAEFINYRQELPEEFWQFQIKPTYFDFWAISQYQLQKGGILPHHIEMAKISTYSDSDYFSYRREKKTGRQGTCAMLSKV